MAVSSIGQRVIGTGIQAPFQFSIGKSLSSVSLTGGLDKIISSIKDILQTRPGERVMQPEYGSRLFDLVFEQNDPITHQLLEYYTAEALRRWEKRISITSVGFTLDDARPYFVGIVISFTVLATHQTGSYVFPYERQSVPMDLSVTGSESRNIFQTATLLPPENPTYLNPGGFNPPQGF